MASESIDISVGPVHMALTAVTQSVPRWRNQSRGTNVTAVVGGGVSQSVPSLHQPMIQRRNLVISQVTHQKESTTDALTPEEKAAPYLCCYKCYYHALYSEFLHANFMVPSEAIRRDGIFSSELSF